MEDVPDNYRWGLEEQIRQLAYFKWVGAGMPNDMADKFWIEAEQEVLIQFHGYFGDKGNSVG